ncbi:MAG: TAXI family TRAP transporter solute-binding subunit [Hyphomicrobiaceae bacterium]
MTSKRVRQFLMIVFGGLVAIIATLWLAIVIANPGPAGRIVMATGGAGGAYTELAERWKKELARFGVKLELRPTVEGADSLHAVLLDGGEVSAAIVKGGVSGSMQGRLASTADQIVHELQNDRLQSVGRMFHEPLWVFYRGPKLVQSLGEFKGKRIMVGSANSGTRRVVELLLKANGVTAENSKFVAQEFPSDARPLTGEGVDVAFVALPPDSKKIQALLRTPNIYLMDFTAEANAYKSRFPFLSSVVLHRGAVEFDPDIPSADITLLATAPALIVRKDMHPALVTLLTHATSMAPKPGFDALGEPVLFYKAGEFPNGFDPEYEIDPDARTYHKSHELPFLLRAVGPFFANNGIPFWVTAFSFLHATKIILLAIPVLSVAIPLARFLPMLYTYMIRRRLLTWYERLKKIEFTLDHDPTSEQVTEAAEELRRIDRAVSRLKLPLHFSDQLYDLRGHIDLVEQRLVPKRNLQAVPQAAE